MLSKTKFEKKLLDYQFIIYNFKSQDEEHEEKFKKYMKEIQEGIFKTEKEHEEEQ